VTNSGAQAPNSRGIVYRDLVVELRGAGIETAELDARLLLSSVTGVSDVALISDPEVLIGADHLARLREMTAARVAGKPVTRLLGSREFWGLEFSLNHATLDPRPDSETLIELVLAHVKDRAAPLRLLDIGTGTGCLLLALLSELPNARGVGVDCADEAVARAQDNALSLTLGERAEFCKGDWAAGLDGLFDVIVSNPPYIPTGDLAGLSREVREHDPMLALDGGADGLDAYRSIFPQMTSLLAADGFGVVEFGIGQSADVSALAEQAGLAAGEIRSDISGVLRAIMVKPIV
jgi:release factor glutamine methyltransferase